MEHNVRIVKHLFNAVSRKDKRVHIKIFCFRTATKTFLVYYVIIFHLDPDSLHKITLLTKFTKKKKKKNVATSTFIYIHF